MISSNPALRGEVVLSAIYLQKIRTLKSAYIVNIPQLWITLKSCDIIVSIDVLTYISVLLTQVKVGARNYRDSILVHYATGGAYNCFIAA